MTAPGRPAVFLDRDGVINELVPDPRTGRPESPYRPGDVALLPGAAVAVRRLRAAGFLLVAASNQPAAAKGHVTLEDLDAVHARVVELLAAGDARLDDWRYCRHHPEGSVRSLTRDCPCRKPKPGLLTAAIADHGVDAATSWMVGDADTDVAAGTAAGVRTVLVETPGSAHRRGGAAPASAVAPDLSAAAELISGRNLGSPGE